jgi:hypothetical protein
MTTENIGLPQQDIEYWAHRADLIDLDVEARALHDAGREASTNGIPWDQCGEHARNVFRAIARRARELYR